MESPTWWTWVWASSGTWWCTGKSGMLQSMGSKRVRHDRPTELNWAFKENSPASSLKVSVGGSASLVESWLVRVPFLWHLAYCSLSIGPGTDSPPCFHKEGSHFILYEDWVLEWLQLAFLSFERITGRKAIGLQMEEMGCKVKGCFTFFISLLRGRRKQTNVTFFPPSLYKFKKRFLLKFCVAIKTPGSTWT